MFATLSKWFNREKPVKTFSPVDRWKLERTFRAYVAQKEAVSFEQVLEQIKKCHEHMPLASLFYIFAEQFDGSQREALTYEYNMSQTPKVELVATMVFRHKTEPL